MDFTSAFANEWDILFLKTTIVYNWMGKKILQELLSLRWQFYVCLFEGWTKRSEENASLLSMCKKILMDRDPTIILF